MSNAEGVESTYSDNPIKSAAQDSLSRLVYTSHVVRVLNEVTRDRESSVLALIGPWGSGKTSVLNLLSVELEGQEDGQPGWSVKKFNPWLFSDVDSLLASFFAELGAALPETELTVREKLAGYVRKFAPLGKLGSLGGLDLQESMDAVADLVAKDRTIEDERDVLEEALLGAATRILIVLDDIDRLQPDELLLVLKFIRLIGRLPNIHYLLAFDERTLLDVLKNTDLARADETRAMRYLDKMVQVRLDLPLLTDYQRDQRFYSDLQAVMAHADCSIDEEEVRRLQWFFEEEMAEELRNPRSLKRYFSQLRAFLPTLAAEVNIVDFCVITFIRTFRGSLYSQLPAWKGALVGAERPSVREIHGQADPARRSLWMKRLRAAGIQEYESDETLGLMAHAFPGLRAHVESKSYASFLPVTEGLRRVADPEYFDRYFQFGVPEDDLSDVLIGAALDHLIGGSSSNKAAEQVISFLDTRPTQVLRKIRVLGRSRECRDIAPLLSRLAPLFRGLDDVDGRNLLFGARDEARVLGSDLLGRCVGAARSRAIELLVQPENIEYGANVVITLTRSQGASDLTARMAHHLGIAIEASFGASLDSVRQEDFSLFFLWSWLDEENARNFARGKVHDGAWNFLAFLTHLVGTKRLVGSRGPVEQIGDLTEKEVAQYFGPLQEAIELVGDHLGVPTNLDVLEDQPATMENRERYALAFLARQKARLAAEG